MLLCYIDESDEGDIFAFAGVLLRPKAVPKLTRDLDSVMRKLYRQHRGLRAAELHAHDVFHGKAEWADVDIETRVQVFRDVVDATVKHSYRLVMRAVDRRRLSERQDRENYRRRDSPERVSMTQILQRVQNLAKSRRDVALVVADQRHDAEFHHELLAAFKLQGTPGTYWHTDLPNIVDTVHFIPSKHSRAVQAADFLAFLYRRKLTRSEPSAQAQAVMDELWMVIDRSGKPYLDGVWP